ncbi:MAG: hypothetical protein ACLRVU_06860 [Beduini sp.]|mgnify:CR=1 FL=1|uniref:hypothetical protein n=1 Tax=Beduini sp. TaxID=1922300 RepID=UPI0039A12971
MTIKKHLIEVIADDLGCEYVSDLHTPKLLESLQRLAAGYDSYAYPLKEWQELIRYISRISYQFKDEEEAKQFFMHL